WLNYTRTFHGRYRVYLRAATTADTTANPRAIQLDRVTSDRTQPDQTLAAVGQFSLVRSGLLLGLRTVPLVDAGGASVTAELEGLQTVRLTASDAGNDVSVNYLVFVPESASAPTAPRLGNPTLSGTTFTVSFPTEAGVVYALDTRTNLGSGDWQRLTPTVTGDGTTKSLSATISET